MEAKNTKIYMIVDTKHIKPGKEDEYVKFKDNRRNKDPKGDPVNFTSEIDPGAKVFWFGEPENEERDTIEITGIKQKGAGPVLIDDIGKDPQHRGAYMAQVVEDYTIGLESYSITFRIKDHKAEYEVDPKLVMAPTS